MQGLGGNIQMTKLHKRFCLGCCQVSRCHQLQGHKIIISWPSKKSLLNSIMESEKNLRVSDLIQEIYFLSYQTERILEYFQFLTKRISSGIFLCRIFQLISRIDYFIILSLKCYQTHIVRMERDKSVNQTIRMTTKHLKLCRLTFDVNIVFTTSILHE